MVKDALDLLNMELNAIKDDRVGIALRDLFALGCLLYLKGEKNTGIKVCNTALLAVGFSDNYPSESETILQSIETNEKTFVNEIRAHLEINALFQ
ncbi:MAG: hypothetical protein ACE5GN_06265 [Waddliaceae bacterium]